mgnify:FL=1
MHGIGVWASDIMEGKCIRQYRINKDTCLCPDGVLADGEVLVLLGLLERLQRLLVLNERVKIE